MPEGKGQGVTDGRVLLDKRFGGEEKRSRKKTARSLKRQDGLKGSEREPGT